MKLFNCTCCRNLVYFENVLCVSCQSELGFLPDEMKLAAIEPLQGGSWGIKGKHHRGLWHKCANYSDYDICNWMLPDSEVQSGHRFCRSCRLTRMIPDLSVAGNKFLWYKLETEKRRLVYSLLRLGLPLVSRLQPPQGLAFDFKADDASRPGERVLTGHAHGIITINISEADPVLREKMRFEMNERYRTILGHFRHESAHYYWDVLVRDQPCCQAFRHRFGDETRDYAQALARHHEQGPPEGWHDEFVSAYASSHPWEDWAETWAHYLHMVDTLETAHHFGLKIDRHQKQEGEFSVAHDFDAYEQADFQTLVRHWVPLTLALNSINRSMGHAHVYPFVLTDPVLEKLAFVHEVIRGSEGLPSDRSAQTHQGTCS